MCIGAKRGGGGEGGSMHIGARGGRVCVLGLRGGRVCVLG